MRGSLYALCALVVAGSCAAGCGAPAEAEANPVKAAEDALFDQLTCSDVARPSTLARVRAVFDHPSAETVGALATNPQDLATLVSVAGPEAEAGIVAVKNAVRVPDLFEHGWDGVQCKEPFTLDCTAGSETVDVQCAAGAANRIDLRFDKCTLGGSVLDGAVSLVKSGDDARAVFDALSVDETQVIEGAVTLKLASSSSTFEASLTTDDGLSLVDHGGPDGGLSCGEVLRIDALGVSGDGRDVIVDLAGFHQTVDEKIGVTTLDDGLRFDGACGCPRCRARARCSICRSRSASPASRTPRCATRRPPTTGRARGRA